MKIKDLEAGEQPREKMLAHGASMLSSSELLAVLLRTGSVGKNVLETAQELLGSADNSLVRLAAMSPEAMARICGVGRTKALVVVAALELGKRLCVQKQKAPAVIDNADDAAAILRTLYTSTLREECWCLFLKRSRALLGSLRVSEGGETMTEINIKRIVRKALDLSASAVILSHNHPGGDHRPSIQDIRLTKQLKQALAVFELSLTDHIIISDNGYYSFALESESV